MKILSLVYCAFLIPTGAIVLRTSYRAADCDAWDGMEVFGSDSNHQCEWVKMSNGPKMCCRGYHDVVSDAVKASGFWEDCPALESWWTFLQNRSGQSVAGHGKFYVDVGSNIGSCLLSMTARPDVQNALAFEPNPANLFYLTSSILANPQIKEKVQLYPFALGATSETDPIYTEPGNAGNTVVGKSTHTRSTHVAGEVKVRKLDDVLMNSDTPPYIHLMKMDAQGYEVKIIQGASKLFASGAVNAIKFELATDWLVNQGTSPAEYLNAYLNHGFEIHDTDTKQLVSQERMQSSACGAPIIQDFVAVRVKVGEIATQKPIVC